VTTTPVNGFDRQTALAESDRHRYFSANVQQILREDYLLRGDEADLAFGRYLRRQTRWVTPDEAAYYAYRWWTPTVDPSVVLAREAEQRIHARMATSTDLDLSEPRETEAILISEDADLTRADYVEADLAAAESALSLIRQQGRRSGFTSEHVELAGHLKQMLDESSLWDTIVPDDTIAGDGTEPAELEPALRPDTVRPVDEWDDMIVIDAAFAGTTITVMRPPGPVDSSSYVFMTLEPGKRSIMRAADLSTMGMIAAGDRQPEPSRADEYERLGKQVRNHLIGLVDAVADARELRSEQESRRLHAAQAGIGSPVEAGYQRPQPTGGPGR
jgi:hypothetical protein